MASPNSSLICGCFTPLWRFGRRCQKWNILENIHATKIHWLVSQTQPSASYWLFLRSFYQTCTPSSYLPEYPKCKTLLSPLLFSSFPLLLFFSLPIHQKKKKKRKLFFATQQNLYGNSRPLFFCGKGRDKCLLPSNLKVAACQTGTHGLPYATVGLLISNVGRPNYP